MQMRIKNSWKPTGDPSPIRHDTYLWFIGTVAECLFLARIKEFLFDILRQQWQEVVLVQVVQVVQLHDDLGDLCGR